MTNHNEIILYQLNEDIKLEVKLEEETVWLTQAQMTILFETTKQNISLHINNIFKERELDRNSVVKYSLTTALDGKNYLTRYYNLDVIISVGYRVKSLRGTQFRIVLKRGCLQATKKCAKTGSYILPLKLIRAKLSKCCCPVKPRSIRWVEVSVLLQSENNLLCPKGV